MKSDLRETGRESAREMRWRELGDSLEGGAWDGEKEYTRTGWKITHGATPKAPNERNHREKKERRELVAGRSNAHLGHVSARSMMRDVEQKSCRGVFRTKSARRGAASCSSIT